jgi:alpha-ketoglutarate-dependent taurine dioxygenase
MKRAETLGGLIGAAKRKPMTVSQDNLVQSSHLENRPQKGPLVLLAGMPGVDLAGWAAESRPVIERHLLKYGGVLFREFKMPDADAFRAVVNVLSTDLLDYSERAAPRTQVKEKVYTSTEFPADQYIPLHHEMSYTRQWPRKIWFYCETPAPQGGCTPITDDREVFALIPDRIKDVFMTRKVMYVRNFGEGVDMSWQVAFQTENPREVERYCDENGIAVEWRSHGRLRTRQVRPATVRHPENGDEIWFNHAHLFHWSNVEPSTRSALLAEFTEDELPRNAMFGDGTPIDPALLDEIRAAYEQVAIRFDWRQGDILMLDNVLMSHGRDPFVGPRKILVAMAESNRTQ